MNNNTNYTNFSKQVDNQTDEPILADDVNITVDEATDKPIIPFGIVIGCKKLNVRQEPNKNSEVLCVIEKGTEVEYADDETYEDFYQICTPTGVIGYCMKQYIKIK